MLPGEFPTNLIFAIILIATLVFFGVTVSRLVRILRLGKPEDRFDRRGARLRDVIVFVFGQKEVLAQPAGLGHFFIFWGFVILSLGTLETFIRGFAGGFSYAAIIGETLYAVFGLLLDFFCAAVIVAIIASVIRRLVMKPVRLETDDPHAKLDALIILGLIFVLVVCLELARAVELELHAAGPALAGALWAPLVKLMSGLFDGASPPTLRTSLAIFWWIHTLLILAFLTYIPFGKHLHILGAIPNIYFRHRGPRGLITKMDLEEMPEDENFGIVEIKDLTWKQILDTYACTECGRCQAECPAYATQKPLTPYGVIHHMKAHVKSKGSALVGASKKATDELPETAPPLARQALAGEVVSEDEIWSCTTCLACEEVCPAFITVPEKLVGMRRSLVLMESRFPKEIQTTFQNFEVQGNPWGIGRHTRGDWAKDLGVKVFSNGGGNGQGAEYLLWVGCAGSLDARNQRVSRAVVRLLQEAGVDFAILGEEEGCCGDSARRLGNEYLFQMLAEANVETFKKYEISKIITTCPHGFNIFRHEYPQFGANYELHHHTDFIARLIEEGRLPALDGRGAAVHPPRPARPLYHDSCYLGRYNDIYEAPRTVLRYAVGVPPLEMARRTRRSFCCGAGGGRMWMEENLGVRINHSRTEEALGTGARLIATACPFCLTMFEDGLKELGKEEVAQVLDVSEVLAARLERSPQRESGART